jgi:magnesium transporter
MVTEFLAYPKKLDIAGVLDDLRANADEYTDYSVQYLYVVDGKGVLVGVIRLRDMLLSPPATPLTSIMIENPLYMTVESTLDEMNQFFDRYPFVGVPVVDAGGRLVGVVRRGDAEQAAGERAEQSLMRFGGIIGGEEFRSMPLSLRAFRRLVWLTINLGLSLLAASVILRFEGTVESVLALAFFIPVIANMSGCSGNQAVAVSIRELAAGLIETRDFLRVLGKELQAGIVIGVLMGGALGVAAYLLEGSLWLAVVVGAALLVNIVFALLLGGLTPLLVRKAGADPALAAPLLVTTLADFTGFLLVLSLAAWFLGRGLL